MQRAPLEGIAAFLPFQAFYNFHAATVRDSMADILQP